MFWVSSHTEPVKFFGYLGLLAKTGQTTGSVVVLAYLRRQTDYKSRWSKKTKEILPQQWSRGVEPPTLIRHNLPIKRCSDMFNSNCLFWQWELSYESNFGYSSNPIIYIHLDELNIYIYINIYINTIYVLPCPWYYWRFQNRITYHSDISNFKQYDCGRLQIRGPY